MKHNFAARKVAQARSDLRWLHLIHSATTPGILHTQDAFLDIIRTPFPNSFVIFPNAYDIPRVARNMGYEEFQVKCVPHATDICDFFDMHPMSRRIIDTSNMLQADVIGCYPLRLDRGKQPHYVIRTFAALKALKLVVRLVIVDFHSTGGDKVTYRKEMLLEMQQRGLSPQEIIFTSQFDKSLVCTSPRSLVRDFMMISNVFILPSRSETYSLVAQEAGLCKNLLVLNQDFPPMRSIYGEMPLYRQFSSNINANTGLDGNTETNYDNEMLYWKDLASAIWGHISHDKALHMATKLRMERNPYTIFKKHLEPLFYMEIR